MKNKIIITTLAFAMVFSACSGKEPDTETGAVEETSGDESAEVNVVESSARFGELKSFSLEQSQYTDMFSQDGPEVAWLEVDFDNDGGMEAIALAGTYDGAIKQGDDEEYFYAYLAYFIDDDGSSTEMTEYALCEIAMEQYVVATDAGTYLCLNGDLGADGIGSILYTEDDTLKALDFGGGIYGRKYFADQSNVVWLFEDYRMSVSPEDGSTIAETLGSGRSTLPYVMKLEGNQVTPYEAREVSRQELNDICYFDIDPYVACDAFQLIYRENGELDVNYAEKDDYGYNFNADIYYLSGEEWVKSDTMNGYFDIVPTEENTWDYLH